MCGYVFKTARFCADMQSKKFSVTFGTYYFNTVLRSYARPIFVSAQVSIQIWIRRIQQSSYCGSESMRIRILNSFCRHTKGCTYAFLLFLKEVRGFKTKLEKDKIIYERWGQFCILISVNFVGAGSESGSGTYSISTQFCLPAVSFFAVKGESEA